MVDKNYGEMFGAGMTAQFIKDKADTAHVRGYATLIHRVTSPDAPDNKAVYNLHQVDFYKAMTSDAMYDELKNLTDYILNRYISHPSTQLKKDLTDKALLILSQIENRQLKRS